MLNIYFLEFFGFLLDKILGEVLLYSYSFREDLRHIKPQLPQFKIGVLSYDNIYIFLKGLNL